MLQSKCATHGDQGMLLANWTQAAPLHCALVHQPAPSQSFAAPENKRPVVEQVEDGLDMWGRPKRQVGESPLAVMPEQERAKAEVQLEQQQATEARRAGGGNSSSSAGAAAAPAANQPEQ